MTDYITEVTVPTQNGSTTYAIRDAAAQDSIAGLQNSLTKALRYRGTTTEPELKDGSTLTRLAGIDADPNNENTKFRTGDIVLKPGVGTGNKAPTEYIFNGSVWNEFGSTGSLGALAFGNKVKGGGTPNGSVGENLSGSINSTPILKGNQYSITSSYTPSGSVQVFVDNPSLDVTVTGNIPDTVDLFVNNTISTSYTPTGSITTPTFTGIEGTVSIETSETNSNPNYTPAGTILYNGQPATTPTVNVVLNKESISGIKNLGSLPSLNYDVNNEELKITWNAGSLAITEEKNFATSVSSATMGAFTFRGQGASITGRHKPAGSISTPSFNGNSVNLKAQLSGDKKYSFSGSADTDITATASFSGNSGNATGNISPSDTEWYVGPLSLAMNSFTITSTVTND